MRLVPILLTALSMTSLNACYPFDGGAFFGELFLEATTAPGIRLQLQGTVTAADDGLPIAGATVKVVATCHVGCVRILASATTDDSGRYSLSFTKRCAEEDFFLETGAEGFRSWDLWYFSDPHLRCTKEKQTIDFQLERDTA